MSGTDSLLEVGSGPVGIGFFRKVPFVGCDVTFSSEPHWPMTPVKGSATALPFKDQEFEVVIASDVMEHIPPDVRRAAVSECLRVARKVTILGFPCGQRAWKADEALVRTYLNRKLAPPDWLSEHMEAPFPEPALFQNVDGWTIAQTSNESLSFHSWLMRREMSPTFVRLSSRLMRMSPGVTAFLLKQFDHDPAYRQIFTLTRREDAPAR